LPSDILDQVKGFIMLDGLAKIMMLIEGFFALSAIIPDKSRGYSDVPRTMAHYSLRDVSDFIKSFRAGECRCVPTRRYP